MKARFWYQSMTSLTHLPNYKDALQRHAKRVCQEGVEVSVNGISDKWFDTHMPTEMYRYTYAKHVIQNEVIGICRNAEAQGYDAVILGSFSEPFLGEIRSLLDIPVVGMAESAMLLACSMGGQFTLVALNSAQVVRLQPVTDRHALGGRMREIVTLTHPVNERKLDDAFKNPAPIIEDFSAAARRAVSAGADVIIPAEGVLNEVMFWNEVKCIDDAVVMDAVGASLLYAELMVSMKRKTGLGVGRRWAYVRPPQDVLKVLDENS